MCYKLAGPVEIYSLWYLVFDISQCIGSDFTLGEAKVICIGKVSCVCMCRSMSKGSLYGGVRKLGDRGSSTSP